jgi:hypothetical protein
MAIVRRNNRYGVKVYVVGEGQRWVGTFDTLREAKRAEREAAVEAAKPKPKLDEEKCEEFAVRFWRSTATAWSARPSRPTRRRCGCSRGTSPACRSRPSTDRWRGPGRGPLRVDARKPARS